MNPFVVEVAAFALRWLHVVAAIAWIGESFYFVMLDRSLKPQVGAEPNVVGESWSVHGGGFYHQRKFMPAPAQLPEDLHWSKWKSYTTWLTGFALLCVLYLASPRLYLIDPEVARLTDAEAVGLVLAFLAVSWLAYDALCRLLGFRDRVLGIVLSGLVLLMCYAATHLFTGSAAFLLVGAALGTIMTFNVFLVIIPGQRRLVAALARGEAPDPLAGLRGKQRSVHNTYFTLPVVFAMLANHFALAHANEYNWLVLAVFMAAGALIRQFFVLWHSGQRAWWLLAVGGLGLLAAFAWLAPRAQVPAPSITPLPGAAVAPAPNPTHAPAPAVKTAVDEPVEAIVSRRCGACHSARPTMLASAPKGTILDSRAQIDARAQQIYQQVVQLRIMPPGNLTQMSEAERAAIENWYAEAHAAPP